MNFNDIDLQINNHYNCYQCAIETAARLYGVDYQMLGIGTCNFNYLRNSGLIGERINPHFFRDKRAWRKYSRITTQDLDYLPLEKEKIIDLLDEHKVLLTFGDVYNCPWTKVYHKNHYFHAFLIVGYQETTNMFLVIDTYMGSGILQCSIEDLKAQVSGIEVFIIRPEPVYPKKDYIGEIKNDAFFYFEKESDKCMSDFIADMSNEFDFDREINCAGANPYMVALTSNLDMLLRNRKGYQILLEYYGVKFDRNKWKTYSEILNNVINSITRIKLELLKAGTRKRYTDDNRRVVINELVAWKEAESGLMRSLLEI